MSQKVNGTLLRIVQLGLSSYWALSMSILYENPAMPKTQGQWGALLCLIIMCSTLLFLVYPRVREKVSRSRELQLYVLLPITAFVLGMIFQEKFTVWEYIGLLMILHGAVVILYHITNQEKRRIYHEK